ncbi:MAG: TlpA family protein disulfide reductase [Dehalococcoidia bacterium]
MGSTALPAFTLQDSGGVDRSFPTGRPALLCFVKEDCPTCGLSMPLIEAAHRAFGPAVDVWAIGQDRDGNALLEARHNLTLPLLDDDALGVSYAYDLDTVPTVILTDAAGAERRRFVGFGRADWQGLMADLAHLGGAAEPAVDWGVYPESRPGCGSRSVEPGMAERLAAEAAGSPLRARRIEIALADDPFEFLFDQGLTDGLPVVPPTPERVLRMLAGTRRPAQEVVAIVPPNMAPVTVEKVAINAVMAGCRPDYLPVVIAAIEAVCTDTFNVHGVLATTSFPGPIIIVNGPIRHRIGMNMKMNVLGQGNRANSTIGRAVQLVVRNVGGGRPGDVDRAALGQPGKVGLCFPEYEERSNWEPLHVERGYSPEESVVTVYAGGAPTGISDQLARDAATLAVSYGQALAAMNHPKAYGTGEVVVVVPPEHVDTIAKSGWSKNQFRAAIQRATLRPARDLARGAGGSAEGMPAETAERLGRDTLLPKFRSDEMITLVVAGGEAGKFGAYFHNWVYGPMGSIMTSRRIEE